MRMHYAVVTWGTPTTKLASYYRSEKQARVAATAARGTGTCTGARVHSCASRAQAKSAVLGVTREGESCICVF